MMHDWGPGSHKSAGDILKMDIMRLTLCCMVRQRARKGRHIRYGRLLNVRARGSVSKMRKCEQTRMISSGTIVASQPREALDVVLYKMYVLKPFNSLYASRRAKFPSTCPIHDSLRSVSAKSLQLLDNEI